MDLDQAGASRSELLIATCKEAKFHTASWGNGTETGSAFLTPGKHPGRVGIVLGAPARRFTALATKFINGARNEGVTSQKDRKEA